MMSLKRMTLEQWVAKEAEMGGDFHVSEINSSKDPMEVGA